MSHTNCKPFVIQPQVDDEMGDAEYRVKVESLAFQYGDTIKLVNLDTDPVHEYHSWT